MAPTAFEKAENDRDAVITPLKYLEKKLVDHVTTPINEYMSDKYLTQINLLKANLLDANTRMEASAPAGTDMGAIEKTFFDLLTRVEDVDMKLYEIKSKFAPATTASSSATGTPPPPPHHADVRLPRLELPSFDGNLNQWISFRDMFKTAVHKNATLSDAQKLTYLKSALKGEAGRLIETLSLSDANYVIAWKQLKKRYHNERDLIFAIFKKFMEQPNVTANSSSSMRTLIDVTENSISSLGVLKLTVDKTWDNFISYFILTKLDQTSKELWEQTQKGGTIAAYTELLEFLEQRARSLAGGPTGESKSNKNQHRADNRNKVFNNHAQATSNKCKACSSSGHPLYKCSKFRSMSVKDRHNVVKTNALCFNCLRDDHSASNCPMTLTCRHCSEKHNTLLHRGHVSDPPAHSSNNPPNVTLNHHSVTQLKDTMLATAIVKLRDSRGQLQSCRALLDGGANASIISKALVKRLGLKRDPISAELVGVESVSLGTSKGIVSTVMTPRFASEHNYHVQALVMTKVTSDLPRKFYNPKPWSHLQGLQLADPNYFKPGEIDILLGADVFYEVLLDGKKKPWNKHGPMGLNSTLGWLVGGKMLSPSSQVNIHHTNADLDAILVKFWEIENVPSRRILTQEEGACEDHFQSTHTVDNSGKFTVSLPFKTPLMPIGNSRELAVRRLKQLERRFAGQPNTQQQYREFMAEYLSLGHMELVPDSEVAIPRNRTCYTPHHFVLKESSTTTKFRVVFDASAKTTNGVSFNDGLMVGPTIQDNLINILMRFRMHPIAFTADIAKMYRQILVNPAEADMQRIVWRDLPSEPIKDYRLLTVTYGTAAAPFLATRVLQQLAENHKESVPLAAITALNDFYVDDLMSGASTEDIAVKTQSQLIQLMKLGGMELRKWSSNSSTLLNAIPEELRETQPLLSLDIDPTIKTLGVYWNPASDEFNFKVNLTPIDVELKLTKRTLLSEISKIFDPLGWLAPTIIKAKIMIQQMWKLELGWDTQLPEHIQQEWKDYRADLSSIEQIAIPRCMIPSGYITFNLAGFCDASEKAYAAVVYLCASMDNGPPLISLITSKTRVAPAKQVSLPRLELNGAQLLAQLIANVQGNLKLSFNSVMAWTDSTVVLAWIQAHPSRWKTYVANRVTEIQSLLPPSQWRHVSGIENPADCASRGLNPSELQPFSLWWNGPTWLSTYDFASSEAPILSDDMAVKEEERPAVIINHVAPVDDSLLRETSSLWKLKVRTAWIFRFYNNCLAKVRAKLPMCPSTAQSGPLTPVELENALCVWIWFVQLAHLQPELRCLKQGKPLPNKSAVLSLDPFLDEYNLMRVGGRLRKSALPVAQKHPILLPRHHLLTKLIIDSEHRKNLHAGPQLPQSIIQQKFWIIRARDAIRQQLKQCVICFRSKPKTLQQFMGDLPAARITPARPFLKCGVDFAGPFTLKSSSPRSKVTFKAYLSIFVCFTTHAVHLELVSALSTDAFLAALHRFIARRGKPSDIYSDNGTNFVGAAKEIKEVQALFKSATHNHDVSDNLAKDGIHWHFNPPGAPHFGGLWEAGVKSVKYHLHRVVGLARLTFEELATTLTQIEACLNSRPLTPTSTDPYDFTALTPGHFLIGTPLTALPELDLTHLNPGRLSRWQIVQQMQQHFWKRWSAEYLTRLQQRPKWLQHRENLQLDDLVLIKDDNLPPLKWKLGRVIELHTGDDGLVRVVNLRTAVGEFKRPIHKLCLLPMDPASSQPTIMDSSNDSELDHL